MADNDKCRVIFELGQRNSKQMDQYLPGSRRIDSVSIQFWRKQLQMPDAQCLSQFVDSHNCGIALPALQIGFILLRQSRKLAEFFLTQPFFLSDPADIVANKFAHTNRNNLDDLPDC